MNTQVTINVEPALLGLEIGALIASLPEETKIKIATQVVKDFLLQPHDAEIRSKEGDIIKKIRSNFSDWDQKRYPTDDDIRHHHSDYRSWANQYQDTRTIMLKQITETAQAEQRKVIQDLVVNDPQIKQVVADQVALLKDHFPAIVQTALINMFSTQLANMANSLTNLPQWQSVMQQNIQGMNQQLLENSRRG